MVVDVCMSFQKKVALAVDNDKHDNKEILKQFAMTAQEQEEYDLQSALQQSLAEFNQSQSNNVSKSNNTSWMFGSNDIGWNINVEQNRHSIHDLDNQIKSLSSTTNLNNKKENNWNTNSTNNIFNLTNKNGNDDDKKRSSSVDSARSSSSNSDICIVSAPKTGDFSINLGIIGKRALSNGDQSSEFDKCVDDEPPPKRQKLLGNQQKRQKLNNQWNLLIDITGVTPTWLNVLLSHDSNSIPLYIPTSIQFTKYKYLAILESKGDCQLLAMYLFNIINPMLADPRINSVDDVRENFGEWAKENASSIKENESSLGRDISEDSVYNKAISNDFDNCSHDYCFEWFDETFGCNTIVYDWKTGQLSTALYNSLVSDKKWNYCAYAGEFPLVSGRKKDHYDLLMTQNDYDEYELNNISKDERINVQEMCELKLWLITEANNEEIAQEKNRLAAAKNQAQWNAQ